MYWLIGAGSYFDEELLAYLPADVTDIQGMEVDRATSVLGDTDKVKMLRTLDYPRLREIGIESVNMKRFIIGFGAESGLVVVARMKEGIDKDKATKKLSAANTDGKTYYRSSGSPGFYYIESDKIAVFTEKEETLKNILKRDLDKPVIPEPIQELVKAASDGTNWHSFHQQEMERPGANGRRQGTGRWPQ